MSYAEICECGCTKEGHFEKKGARLTRGCEACKQYRDRLKTKNVSAWDELRKVLPDHKIEPPAECGVAHCENPTAVQRCYDKPGHEGAHRSRNGFIWLDTIKLDITIGDTVTVNGKSISHPPVATIAEAVAKLEAANPGDKIAISDEVYDAMSAALESRPPMHEALFPKDIYVTARVLEKTCEVPYAIHSLACDCDDCAEYNVDDPARLAQAKAAAEFVIAKQDTTGHKPGAFIIRESFKGMDDPDRIAKAFRDSMMAWSTALRKDPLKQE